MENSSHYLSLFLGLGAVGLQIVCVLTLLCLVIFGKEKNFFLSFVKKNFLWLGLILSFVPAIFSLYYSEILNFAPCHLCWLQRIFLFPQVFLFAVALWKKDRGVFKYSLPLVIVGALISLYHNFFYYFGEASSLPCDSSGVSCYQHLISELGGYISIPMLSLTSFASLLTLLIVVHCYKQEN